MTTCGCKSSLCSIITVPIRPVASSTSRLMVTPAIISRNSILPPLSVRIGTLYGSHCTNVSPFFTVAPSSLEIIEPMTTLYRSSSRPSALCTLIEPNCAIVFRFNDRLLERLAGRAADVEGSHRQLRSRLADGLRGDNANCFAHFHELASSEVASVAHRANAAA